MYDRPTKTTNFEDVGIFHEKFGLDNTTIGAPGPRGVEEELINFRVKFMKEEVEEFEQAWDEGNEAEMFDALLDLVYVAMGTAHLLGYPWHEGWTKVQEANMKKVRATSAAESKRGSSYDVVKPEGWTAPDINAVLERWGW